ncbi:MAG TPA: glycerol kinase GlpK [Kiritimatiellia bacterium]|nr:glycerol kinase GlpK [Kiritimatiellia bacterium]HRU69708.1 glycerol kinase GlpK [Kiritimatiellia bacterium]
MPMLTLREREILRQIAAGLSNKEVAHHLGLSAHTVAAHVRSGFKKLNIHSRKELAAVFEPETRQAFQILERRATEAQHILVLDQGTDRSRAMVINKAGQTVASARKELTHTYPKPGWVELDGLSIWSSQAGVAAEALAAAGVNTAGLAAVGITGQRETTLVWDRETGQPVYPAISWQDRRSDEYCERLKRDGYTPWIQSKTGLVPDSYFSATKIKWILDHVKGARRLAESGQLLFGTVNSWLVWNCTRGEVHVTDTTNASRTMLYNLHTGTWDRELLAFFGIPARMLPSIRSCSEVYGVTRPPFIAEGVPIAGMAGDQQAALFGQRCVTPGMVKNTYGTGCFLVMHTGIKPIMSRHNLLTTVAWAIGGKTEYALEGSIFTAGAAVQWLCDGLGLLRQPAEVEALAGSVPDNGGLYFVPAFAGLGAPYWNQNARGTLAGLTRVTKAGHLARAALESIAYQTRDVIKAMEADARIPVKELRVDGEFAANDFLMRFQSDILGKPVRRAQAFSARAMGAAYLAGLAVGYWSDAAELDRQWQEDQRFDPALETAEIRRLERGWRRALRAAVVE